MSEGKEEWQDVADDKLWTDLEGDAETLIQMSVKRGEEEQEQITFWRQSVILTEK